MKNNMRRQTIISSKTGMMSMVRTLVTMKKMRMTKIASKLTKELL